MSEWKEYKFEEVAQFPPKVTLEKGKEYSFIPMEDLDGGYKYVTPSKIKTWTGSGGAKFENGDTLFARITPCLQNGKIAQAKGLKEGKGFGSTEYFIFRGKEGISDSDFIYYFSQTEEFRKYAIGSMVGASGRQRADAKFVSNYLLTIPSLPTQRRIASILSAYDDLIENNLKRIKLLEELAQRTYEEWFVHFRISGEDLKINEETGLPEGWEKRKLKDIATITMGQSPKSEFYNFEKIGLPFHQGVKDYGNRFPENNTWSSQGSRFAEKGDILFSVRAPVGRLNIAIEKIILGRGLSAITHKENKNSFLFYQLQKIFFKEDLMGGGAIFNSVTKNDMENITIICPSKSILERFEKIISKNDVQIETLTKQNRLLKESRDLLLPRLMSGAIQVDVAEEQLGLVAEEREQYKNQKLIK